MMDFLKNFPFITVEQYLWYFTIPQIRLMSYDATRVIYLSEKQAKKYKEMQRTKPSSKNKVYDNADDFAAALGI